MKAKQRIHYSEEDIKTKTNLIKYIYVIQALSNIFSIIEEVL